MRRLTRLHVAFSLFAVTDNAVITTNFQTLVEKVKSRTDFISNLLTVLLKEMLELQSLHCVHPYILQSIKLSLDSHS